MQDEPTSPGADAPKPEPTVANAFHETKEAFAAAGDVIDANVKKAVKKVKTAVKKAVKKATPAKKKVAKKKVAKKKVAKKKVGQRRSPRRRPRRRSPRRRSPRRRPEEGRAEGEEGGQEALAPAPPADDQRGRLPAPPFLFRAPTPGPR